MKKEAGIKERPLTAVRKAELLERIGAYLDENLTRRITLKDISENFQVSISTVTQLFQKKAGITFHQYLTQKRMAAAAEEIHRGVPLEEVGKNLGYTDHSSFYRAFKQHYGVSPRDFKQGKEA